jgi:RNA polymerase sigma-70 factor, ECF subfamily
MFPEPAEPPAPAQQTPADIKRAMVELLPNLRAFARSLCPNPARADDLVQDSIVKALANLDRFEPGSNLRAWMFTILRNTFYSDLRKSRREVEDVDGEHAARLADRRSQMGAVDLEDFKRAFAQLSADHREVLTLVGAFGVAYEEAAEICGCAVGTIKSRVNRARARLAELMGVDTADSLGDPDEQALPQGVIAAPW